MTLMHDKHHRFDYCTLYTLFWCLYKLQGPLNYSGSLLSQVLLLLILLFSVYHFFIVNCKYKLPLFLKALNCLVIMFVVYGLILIGSGEVIYFSGEVFGNFIYIKQILMSILPIYSYYYYTLNNYMDSDKMLKYLGVFFILVFVHYFWSQKNFLFQMIELGSSRTEFTNNLGYSFIALMPYIVLCKNKIIKYSLLALICIFTLLCMKRGAILIAVICAMIFIYYSFHFSKKREKVYIIILSAAILCCVFFYVDHLINTSDYFNARIEATQKGESSSRDIIYSTLINHIKHDSNIFHMLFGSGANSTYKIAHIAAHNDWLEIAINNGLLGVVVYIAYFITLFITCRRSRKYSHSLYIMLLIILIDLFTRTLFSMSYASISLYTSCILGFLIAKYKIYSVNNV